MGRGGLPAAAVSFKTHFIGVWELYNAVCFYCTAKCISHTETHVSSLLDFLPTRSPRSTEWTPRAVQQALISYLMQSTNSVYVSTPVSQLLPPASCPSGTIRLCSPCVYLEKCFLKKRFIYLLAMLGLHRCVGFP